MPVKSKKPCAYPRCPNITAGMYCDQHKVQQEQTKAESDKQYDRYQRDARSTKFYNSKPWKKLRALIFQQQYGLCQSCLRQDRYVKGDVVDHKTPIKVDWDKRMDPNNLQVMCHKCHNLKTKIERKAAENFHRLPPT